MFLLRAFSALAVLALYGCNSSYPGVITPVAPTPTPTLVSILVGATWRSADPQHMQIIANGRYADGTLQNLTNVVTWQSSDLSVATVSEPGILTMATDGTIVRTIVITAMYQDKVGSLNLTWPPDF